MVWIEQNLLQVTFTAGKSALELAAVRFGLLSLVGPIDEFVIKLAEPKFGSDASWLYHCVGQVFLVV